MKNTDFCAVYRKLKIFAIVALIVLMPTVLRAQQCAPLPLPWVESFEMEGVALPQCWTPMASYYEYPFIYNGGYATSGNNSMAMAAAGGNDVCMLATPRLAHRADSLHVGFHLAMNDGYGILQVGLVSDTSNTASFTPMLTIDLSTAQLGYYEFYTDGYAASDTEAVAFRLSDGRVTFDDLEVEASTPCRRPWMPVVGMVTHTSISFSWSDPGIAPLGYVVRWIDTAAADTSFLTVYANSVLIAGLTPATAYRLDVAALCGGDTTGWLPVGVVSTDVACHQPLSATLEASTANAAVLSWQHDTTGFLQPTATRLLLQDLTLTSSAVDTLIFTGNYAFLENLVTGHRYQATMQALCTSEISAPVSLVFTPLAAPCNEVAGTAASSVSVVNGSARYGYSQMLYPKSIVAGTDSLYGLALRLVGNGIFFPRMLTLYVGQTVDSVLHTNIVSPLMTRVINNFQLETDAEGWVDMAFDSPVAIDTTRNLVVAVFDHTGAPTGTLSFGVHYEPYGGTIYTSSSSLPIDPATFDLPMYSLSQVADLRLYGNCAMGACLPPATVVTAMNDTSLTLRWAGGGDSSVVVCQAEGEESPLVLTVAGTVCTVAPLAASTRYTLRVGVLCGADTVYGRDIVTTTACGTVSLPYVTDFAVGAHPCWQGVQHEVTGGMVPEGVLLSPEVNVAVSTLQVRLGLRATAPEAKLRVGVAASDGSQTVWIDSVEATDIFEDEWIAYLDGYNGTQRNIVINADAGWVLLKASIEPLDVCLPPRRVTVSNVGPDHVMLAWQSGAETVEVFLREADGDAWGSWTASGGQINLTGLSPQTSYVGYAVSHCSGTAEPSVRSWFRFTTDCGQIRYFPYTMGFEASERTIDCWNVVYADPACARANPVTLTDTRSFSGRRALRFGSYNYINSNNYDQYIISPRIVSNDSIVLTFRYYKDNYDSEPFRVGFSTSSNTPDYFLWMDEVEPQAGQWMLYEVSFPAATRYVAIQYMGRGNYYLYIDELAILGPGCAAPQLTMVDEQAEAVAVRWQADSDTTIVAITDGLWLNDVVGTLVVGNTHTFGNLQPGRNYTIGLRSRCVDGRLSDWTVRSVTTIDTACTAPTALSADSIGFTAVRLTWQPAVEGQTCQLALFYDGELQWQSGRMIAPVYLVAGLVANRTYSVLVRAYCSDIPGPWSDTLQFSTAECQNVSDVEYERLDYRIINITWSPAPITTGRCRIEYGVEGFARGTGSVIESASPCRVAGLDPFGNYDFYIQNYCENGVLSDSAAYIYVPSGVGIDDVNGMQLTISPNPASGCVFVGGLVTSAQVSIHDIAGRTMGRWVASDGQLVIDLSAWAPGAYFVRVVSDIGISVKKLIVR